MTRFVLAWEMGANLGHIDRLGSLARELCARGHEVRLLLRDLSRTHERLMVQGLWTGQAPVWLPRLANPPRIGNYAAVLVEAGWLDPAGLAALLQGWRNTLDLLQPEVLVCDHAPTALLATRAWRELPVWAVGTSFTLPPAQPQAPHFPPFAFWDSAAAAQCAAWESPLLASANAALQRLGAPPLRSLPELFQHARLALTSLPEMSHYQGYAAGTVFSGPTWVGDSGSTPAWPQRAGPRVLVYLSPGDAAFAPLMQALTQLRWPVVLHAKGLAAESSARLSAAGIAVSATPVRMDEALAQAELVVGHGGHGTTAAALLAGRPQLLVPSQVEQLMLARRLQTAGLAVLAEPGDAGRTDWASLLQRALQPPVPERVAALARLHLGQNAAASAARLADLVTSA